MLRKKVLTVGMIQTCCYILWNEEEEGCIVIDPGAEPEKIRAACEGRPIQAILLTHGHFDHIGAVRALAAEGTEIVIHALDAPMLADPEMNASWLIGRSVTAPTATRLVADGDEAAYAGVTLKVMHTPGHTPGSVCYDAGNWLFTGDTMFLQGYGRTDLPGGNEEELVQSLRKLRTKLGNCQIFPGH